MEDVFKNNICNFCIKEHKINCFKMYKTTENTVTVYKCENFKGGERMKKEYEEYIKYCYYDEMRQFVCIVSRETPKEVIDILRKKYDIVTFNEKYSN